MLIINDSKIGIGENQYYHLNAEEFYHWLNLHVPKVDHELAMRDYFMATNDPYSMCVGLEFLFMNDYYTELFQLIEKNKKHPKKLNNDWATFFDLTMAHHHKTMPFREISDRLQMIRTDDLSLKCLITFLMISIQIFFYDFDLIVNKLDQFREDSNKIHHSILHPYIQHRLDRAQFFHYWKRNEMILARKFGYQALAGVNNRIHLAYLHINLSFSFMFDDFDSSVYHIKEAYKIVKENNITNLLTEIEENNIPFIYAHFNKPEGIKTSDKSEQAHLALARGDTELAKQLLAEVTEITPFTKYYLGRAYSDKQMLIQSYNDFIEKQSDHFFARLPLMAIQKL
ncbi:AimR family lysis-lysogeny pheromone receptor [Amphibacillus sp. MSJ-3]|uniref:AimR family lysis-lysogeny pheromone receptor n=1 Tax=Amphibacillus sp. MSJ-3 TaxID=2841505 RepID=UPI001C0F2934|nr:AimR family lysis-lysogeny pheromone receptor [Amphibacillus sp. MSJ-3]MBU5595134.1 AimR family lysis-lysogeny pheromone receptor [Amphibacillus sp. MSJ-3]